MPPPALRRTMQPPALRRTMPPPALRRRRAVQRTIGRATAALAGGPSLTTRGDGSHRRVGDGLLDVRLRFDRRGQRDVRQVGSPARTAALRGSAHCFEAAVVASAHLVDPRFALGGLGAARRARPLSIDVLDKLLKDPHLNDWIEQ
eukprot:7193919-Prymnesium_polylepis.1